VDLSGIIFVVLAVAWAVYLIPKALKHHDEVARTRSIDRFSTALRVLARREPVNRRDARLVTTPARTEAQQAATPPASAGKPVTATTGDDALITVSVKPAVSRARLDARRKAARAAARRRRHILTFLLLVDAAVAALAYFGTLRWGAVAVPGALTVLYLVLCRTQVRRESSADFDVLARRPVAEAQVERDEVDDVVEVIEVVATRVDEDGVADFDDTEDTVGIPVALLEAVAVPTTDGGTLWDPLPVTLPTYVTKPRAKRTVRTIELGEPGTWTSGRTPEDTRIAAQAEAESAQAADAEAHRAVGS
jgi:hypothetical protein